MKLHHVRWLLALLVALASMLLPACSRAKAQGGPKAPAKAPRTAAGAGKSASAEPGPARNPATGPARRHPFTPVVTASRRGSVAGKVGTLVLKGIFGSADKPMAVILEGTTAHEVSEGDTVSGLNVLSIRDGEVVLGTGRTKRVLSLYDAKPGDGGSR